MALTDLDLYYIKSVGSLHTHDYMANREPSLLQVNLEEAIKGKNGVIKDFSTLIASVSNRPVEELRIIHGFEEPKTTSSSDNELELDLFNEDLMCIICNGMDVGARNRLLECCDCHDLYHQECHRPPVTAADVDGNWTCQRCKDAAKRLKNSTPRSSPLHAGSSPASCKIIVKNSPPHSRISGTATTSTYKTSSPSGSKLGCITVSKSGSSSPKIASKSSPCSSSSSSTASSTTTTASNSSGSIKSITPNINIISADKRLQIMKKKAAKLHEKRKQLSR